MVEQGKAPGKVAAFVARHGYTFRAFVISALVFPPAAMFIGFKHPTWTRPQRITALTCLFLFLAVMPFVGAAAIAAIATNASDLWARLVAS